MKMPKEKLVSGILTSIMVLLSVYFAYSSFENFSFSFENLSVLFFASLFFFVVMLILILLIVFLLKLIGLM